jgi:hypothetical protein
MDFCAMSIYIFFCIKGDEGEKNIHGRSSLHTKLITFEVSVCYIQRSIFAGREEEEAYILITLSSYPISAMSVRIDGIHLCPNDETTL